MSQIIANNIFPYIDESKIDIKEIDILREKTIVGRIAISPTGELHIGRSLIACLTEHYIKQKKGEVLLRIEDTDEIHKPSMNNGINTIIEGLKGIDIKISNYSDFLNDYYKSNKYIQSNRIEIYDIFIKKLLISGDAYPCRLNAKEIEIMHTEQESTGQNLGIYNNYNKYKSLSEQETIQKIKSGEKYCIRLNTKKYGEKKSYIDGIGRSITINHNRGDIVLVRENGIPTYHITSIIDEFLMGITHIIKTENWLNFIGLHLELYDLLGISNPPQYYHISPIYIKKHNQIRKIDKRIDKEMSNQYITGTLGILGESLKKYLIQISTIDIPKTDPFHTLKKGKIIFNINDLNQINSIIMSNLDYNTLSIKFYNWIQNNHYKYDEFETSILNNILINYNENNNILKYIKNFSDIHQTILSIIPIGQTNASKTEKNILSIIQNNFFSIFQIKGTELYIDIKTLKNLSLLYNLPIGSFYKCIRKIITGKDIGPDLNYLVNIIGLSNLKKMIKENLILL